MTNLDTDLLRTFVTIADAGGFTQAAKQVHRTQSAVSMQMRRLETSVGHTLFQRDGRGVSLTPEGETLLGYARRLLKVHDEALANLRRPDMVGLVRVGTPDDYVGRFLSSILARFAQTYPRVQVEVLCEPSTNLSGLLFQEQLDLALITCTPGNESGEVVRREPMVWAASERYLIHEDDPLPLALFQKDCPIRHWAIAGLDAVGRAHRVAYTSPSFAGLIAAVTAGLAVTVLGRSILPPEVRELTAEEGFPPLPTASITLQRSPGPVSAVAECLARHIAEGFRAEKTQLPGR